LKDTTESFRATEVVAKKLGTRMAIEIARIEDHVMIVKNDLCLKRKTTSVPPRKLDNE
jgi:hypothetical protein